MAIKPPMLKKGDTFGIVTLGSPLDSKIIDERISYLENMGFKVIIGKYVYSYGGFLAATAMQRANDLMDMFENKNVKAILPTRGGVGVADILPYLDYGVISKNPKILSGYSDITVLLNVIYQLSDLITFSSLLLIDFRETTPAYNFNQFFTAVSINISPRQIKNPPSIPFVSKIKGNVTGRLVGGNITSFVGTLGTPYEIDTKDKILFLEETHENINTVYRMITHLRLAGKFKDCMGIVMGECTLCNTSYGKTYQDLINDAIVPLGKPLMTNVSASHGFYKAALPIGALMNLNTVNNTFTVTEQVVQ